MKVSLAALASTLCVMALLCLGLWQHNRELEGQISTLQGQLTAAAEAAKHQQSAHEAALAKAAAALAAAQAERADLQLQLSSLSGVATPTASTTQALLGSLEDGKLQEVVSQKYQLLWGDLTLSPAERDQMKKLLLDRERVLNTATTTYFSDNLDVSAAVASQQTLLADLDGQIAKLLDAKEYAQYELFKDSGFEQFQLGQLGQVLGPDGVLTDDQKHQLLLAKLRHKQHFSQWLDKQAGPEAPSLSLNEAVETYRNGYLQDVRGLVSEHQFKLLQDFETLQFEQMQKSLKAARGD